MITIINLTLILIALILLIILIKCIINTKKSKSKVKTSSIQTNKIMKKVDSLKVNNGNEILDIKNITTDYLLGIVISSSCPGCPPNFEEFLNIIPHSFSSKDYFLFIHENDREIVEYLTLYEQEFQIIFYKDTFIEKLEIEFMPAFFMLDNDGIIKILTPIAQQFVSKLINFGILKT
jgi:hypothetical protein